MYSIQKGIGKAVISFLTVAAAWLAFAGFSDVSVWDLIVHYVKPVVGSMTVGAAITFAINYVKFHTQPRDY
jgi:predicted membrane protein